MHWRAVMGSTAARASTCRALERVAYRRAPFDVVPARPDRPALVSALFFTISRASARPSARQTTPSKRCASSHRSSVVGAQDCESCTENVMQAVPTGESAAPLQLHNLAAARLLITPLRQAAHPRLSHVQNSTVEVALHPASP